MANPLQDYFSRVQALNRQRGMTGNMQYGRQLEPAIAEGYFDSYQKNKLQSQQLGMQREALDLNKQNTKWEQGFKEKSFNWESGFKEKELAAQIDYNLKMLGFKGEELDLAREYQLGMLDVSRQNAASEASYKKDYLDIQRGNLALDRDYKMGSLANQQQMTNAQISAADKANTLGWIGAGINTATGVANYLTNSRLAAAKENESKAAMAYWNDMRSRGISPEKVSEETLLGGVSPYSANPYQMGTTPWSASSSLSDFAPRQLAPWNTAPTPTFNVDPALSSGYSLPDVSYYNPSSSGGTGGFWSFLNSGAFGGGYEPYNYDQDYSFMSY